MSESTARDDLIRLLNQHADDDTATTVDALLEAGWSSPDDTNAVRNQAYAYNSLLWQIAVVSGRASEEDQAAGIVELDIPDLIEAALAAIARDHAAGGQA